MRALNEAEATVPDLVTQGPAGVNQVSVGQRVASSAAWMVLLRISVRLIGLGSTLVLVRLLAPDDFGIIAMASVTVGMLDMLSGFSFDLALIRARDPQRQLFDTVWTLSVLRGFVISVVTIASAPLMSIAMGEPRIVSVMYVLALVPFLKGFENIALVKWQRELKFDKIFRLRSSGKIAGLCAVISAALLFGNYWALVIGQLGSTVVMLLLGYYLLPYAPRLTVSGWRALFHFSKWLVAGNLLTVIDSYSVIFLISRLFGSATLGLYQVAADIGHLPASEVAAPIRLPMYAGYAKIADNLGLLREQVVDGLGITLLLFLPLAVGIAVTADYITPLCLGPRWVGAAPLIAICAMAALFESVWYFTYHIYLVRDAQARFVKIRTIMQIVRIPLMILCGVAYGVVGAVAAIAFTAVLGCIGFFAGLFPLLRMRWSEMASVAWRPVLAVLIMAVAVRVITKGWPISGTPSIQALQLGVLCSVGATVYLGLEFSLWVGFCRAGGPERHALGWIQSLIRNLRRKAFIWRPAHKI